LYIDTDPDAAVKRYVTSGRKGTTRIATLRDMFEPEKDIVLYLDERFYNADALKEAITAVGSDLSIASVAGDITYTSEQDSTASDGVVSSVIDNLSNLTKSEYKDVNSVVKTNGKTSYNARVRSAVAAYDAESKDKKETLVMTADEIDYWLAPDTSEDMQTFSVLQPLAVVSAIYRDPALWNIISGQLGNSMPVFVSSQNLFQYVGVDHQNFGCVYNYAMLKNLSAVVDIDVDIQADMDKPLYMDIYGNILTDSGLVVIPAMSNASLFDLKKTNYDVITMGFCYLYSQGVYELPATFTNSDKLEGILDYDEISGTWQLGAKMIDNVILNLSSLPWNDVGVVKRMYMIAEDRLLNINGGPLSFDFHVYMITEVLRGAPLEEIDKVNEKLYRVGSAGDKVSKYIATKLADVCDALLNGTIGDWIVSLPNIAFVDKVEYIILFAFKIIFVILFLLLIYRVYIDAIEGCLGLKSIGSFILSVVLFLVTAFAVPELMDLSYYQMNKLMLKNDTAYIAMLNLTKKDTNREIDENDHVHAPETRTKFYLKMEDISIPWYAILDDVLLGNTFTTISDIYEEEYSSSVFRNLPGMVTMSGAIYMDVDTLFEKSVVGYDTEQGLLYSGTVSTPFESFITPYYFIMDNLVNKINNYNIENKSSQFDTELEKNDVVTKGLIKPYFSSTEFMVYDQDILGMKNLYGIDVTYINEVLEFDYDILTSIKASDWCVEGGWYSVGEIEKRLDSLNETARKFIADNRELLGQVSDSTFLKVMSLFLACEYNNQFRTGNAQAIEIYKVDPVDLLRFSLADRKTVTSQISKSFAKFVYDNADAFGCVAVVFLILVYAVGTFLKVGVIIVIVSSMVISAVIRRVIRKDGKGALEGMVITLGLLCGINALYSIVLKGTMLLAQCNFSTVNLALFQILLQCTYCALLVLIAYIVVSDWRVLGLNKYMYALSALNSKMQNRIDGISKKTRNKIKSERNRLYREGETGEYEGFVQAEVIRNSRRNKISRETEPIEGNTGNEILVAMEANDRSRQYHRRRK